MRISLFILVAALFMHLTFQTHKLSQLSLLTSQDLESDQLIEVEETSDTHQISNLTPNYYVIKTIHKEKKQAYLSMQTMFKRVIGVIMKENLIPDEESLVKSKIKPQYLSKKRSWSFSTIFVVFGNESQLERCFKQLSALKVQRLNTQPSINFLNQKVISLKVYSSAKDKLLKALERFGDFEIKEVIEIEIKGAQIQNQDILQIQIEEQQNQSEEIISEEDIQEQIDSNGKGLLQMKIIFRVGRTSTQQTSEGDQIELNSVDSGQDDSSSDTL